ncbi:hypothetical protein [Alteromonas sp. ASW11-130]|uniref:hypothetical protein n=1 Tax=Alteromonas sp. ASW11-130 TaxID=3015775 RepID=UPI002242597F|nr:hypothetical protein [Alteromonas sp. ASW11-130]MCW8092329.1 hypothetical protein [Alteromonas sp. ASW11-130]
MTCLVIAFHYHSLRAVTALSEKFPKGFKRNFTVVACIYAVHCIEIAWFALEIYLAHEVMGLEGFKGEWVPTIDNYLHMAASAFTTLGLFAASPTGNMALVFDIIALTGFTMLTWSATHYYSIFSRN